MNLCMDSSTVKQTLPLIITLFVNVYNIVDSKEIQLTLNYRFFIKKLLENLSFFDNLLKIEEIQFMNSAKILIEPFGIKRLMIVIIVKELIKKNDEKINDALINSKIIKNILELVFKFQWNNMLHCEIEELFLLILKNKNVIMIKHVKEFSIF